MTGCFYCLVLLLGGSVMKYIDFMSFNCLLFFILLAPVVQSMVISVMGWGIIERLCVNGVSFLTFLVSVLLGFLFLSDTRFLGEMSCYLYVCGFSFEVNGLNIFFIILSNFLFLVSFWVLLDESRFFYSYRYSLFMFFLGLLQFFVLGVFAAADLFTFYCFFEASLMPIFVIIGIWGGRSRKIHAAVQFFLYTFLFSIFMLVCIIYLYGLVGSFNFSVLEVAPRLMLDQSFNHPVFQLFGQLTNCVSVESIFFFIWLAFFLGLGVKIPIFPIHLWLPEAHVEAPTIGSVILAGILLKLGTYGMLVLLVCVFKSGCWLDLVLFCTLLGICFCSLTTIRQIDLKKIVAYSSVVHMSYVVLGLFVFNLEGVSGSVVLMLSHGLVSGGLFFCIGVLYDRYHNRNVMYFSGLSLVMPLFTVFFFVLTLANMGLPGTSAFVGEFLIFCGFFSFDIFMTLLTGFGMLLAPVYGLWLYNRVMCGGWSFYCRKYSDLDFIEFFILCLIVCLVIVWGFFSSFLFDKFYLIIAFSSNYFFENISI